MSLYTFCTELRACKGPVNVLLFSKDGTLLLSGGDDGLVRVWNMDDFRCEQVLQGNKWGQVTTLAWVFEDQTTDGKITISIGTGRGLSCLCPMSAGSTWLIWKDSKTSSPFDFNDPIESQAFDPFNQKLVLASHSGQIKMFQVDNCVRLVQLWSASLGNAIPRGLCFFGGANQSILVAGLETGEMESHNANVLWSKTLAGGIGNAVLSSDETLLLVNNLTTGSFDVYQFPGSVPLLNLSPTSSRRFVKQCVFAENSKVAVCGGDNGVVHIVDVTTGESMQTLTSGKTLDMIQTVAATSSHSSRQFVAGGSTGSNSGIYIWEKRDTTTVIEPIPTRDSSGIKLAHHKQMLVNVVFTSFVLLLSYPNWSPYFWKVVSGFSASLAETANSVAKFSNTYAQGPCRCGLRSALNHKDTVVLRHDVYQPSMPPTNPFHGQIINLPRRKQETIFDTLETLAVGDQSPRPSINRRVLGSNRPDPEHAEPKLEEALQRQNEEISTLRNDARSVSKDYIKLLDEHDQLQSSHNFLVQQLSAAEQNYLSLEERYSELLVTHQSTVQQLQDATHLQVQDSKEKETLVEANRQYVTQLTALQTAATQMETAISTLETFPECLICRGVVQRPSAVSTCGHTFCYQCIRKWFRERRKAHNSFNCPLCRTETQSWPVQLHNLSKVSDRMQELE